MNDHAISSYVIIMLSFSIFETQSEKFIGKIAENILIVDLDKMCYFSHINFQ